MTQSIFNSVRKLSFYNFKAQHINQNKSVGEIFKKQSVQDFGSIPEPSCLDFDAEYSLLGIGNKKGLINIYGYPGICYSACLEGQVEIWSIKFISETNYLVTLTSENQLVLWLISPYSNELIKVDTISNLNLLCSDDPTRFDQPDYNNNNEIQLECNITVMEIISFTSSIVMGNGAGSIIQVKLDLSKMKKTTDLPSIKSMPSNSSIWQIPTESDVINKERIISKLPTGSQNRVLLNTVIHISARPGSRSQLLVGYRSGYSIIYDLKKDVVVCLLSAKASLNQLSWCPPLPIIQDNFFVSPDKKQPEFQLSTNLYSCHEDGSVIMWTLPLDKDSILPIDSKLIFPYGDNQKCLSISKILWKSYKQGYLAIFDGGLPRSEYMTKSTITIMNNECLFSQKSNSKLQHVVLDLTSQLIDFHTIDNSEDGSVQYLLVLMEEEFFIVDLTKDDWPILHDQQPYLNCLHHSTITAYHFISEVKPEWFQSLNEISYQKHNNDNLFYKDWPIVGYCHKIRDNDAQLTEIWQNDLLIIGHGDGTIIFWRLGLGGCLQKISTIKSSSLFKLNDESHLNYKDYEDDLIPFRRAGLFDPCCDDIRLAIQLIHFNGNSLLIGGYGGQVVLWGFVDKSYQSHLVDVDLTTHLANFKWKGCQPFQHVENLVNTGSIFQSMLTLLIYPPSQITALDILETRENNNYLFIACGTLHGFVMIACPKQSNLEPIVLTTHCTVPRNSLASQEAALGEGWARRRTREIKKSLRNSFRRLRRRSTKRMEHPSVAKRPANISEKSMKVELVENEIEFDERAIEDRPKDTANDGLIRSLKIHISSVKKRTSNGSVENFLNLFAGLSGGQMIWFQSNTAIDNVSFKSPVNMRLIKQYQFQHRAPVLSFNVFNADQNPQSLDRIDECDYESNTIRKSDQILIVTEEQVRIYSFPSFALKCKTRVTAHDGFRLKSGNMIMINDERLTGHPIKEHLVCATNNGGQLLILNSTNLRKKDVVQFVDKTDLMALSFLSFATGFSLTNIGSTLPYGIHYSGQGQVTLFEIISKSKSIGNHSFNFNLNKS